MPGGAEVFSLTQECQRDQMNHVHFQSDSHQALDSHEKYCATLSTRPYQYEEDLGGPQKTVLFQEDADTSYIFLFQEDLMPLSLGKELFGMHAHLKQLNALYIHLL